MVIVEEILDKKEEKYGLPEYLVMVDCEMTGVNPDKDDLLQIAMLKLRKEVDKYVEFGRPFVEYLNSKRRPQNEFHRKYLGEIFKKANESKDTPDIMKEKIHQWLGELKGTVVPVGDCVPTDIEFLKIKKCIDRSDIINDRPVPGTFHYEYWDMNSLKQVAEEKAGKKLKDDFKKIEGYDVEGIHDALVDCRNQLIELNCILETLDLRGDSNGRKG